MNNLLLTKILKNYKPETDAEERQVKEMLKDLNYITKTEAEYSETPAEQLHVEIVSSDLLLDYNNAALYDIYGKLKHEALQVDDEDHGVDVKDFVQAVHREYSALVTTSSIHYIFDFLQDLWTDNEAYGNNNPDGTFDHNY